MSSIFDLNDDEEVTTAPAVSVPEKRPVPAAPAPKKGGSIFDTFGDDEEPAAPAAPAPAAPKPTPAPTAPTPAQPTPAQPKPVESGDTGDWWEDWKRKQNEAGTPKQEAAPVASAPVPIAGAPPLTGPESDKATAPPKDNTWEDYLHAARSGTGGVISAIGGFIDYSFPETPWHTRVGENVRTYGHEQSKQELDQMSPDAKRRLQESVFQKDEFWSRLGLKTVASVPSMIATLPAGVAGPMGIAAMSYALQSGGTYDDIKQGFLDIPADKLKEMSPAYATMIKNGIDDKEARSRIAHTAAGLLPMASGAVSAITSKFGLESALSSKLVTGVGIRMATGRIGAGAVGAAGEAFQEASENGAQELAKQQAEINGGTRKEIDWWEVWKQAGEGAVIGAVMGGPGGAIVGPEKHAQTATPGGAEQSEEQGPAQAPPAGGPGQASPGDTSAKPAQPPPDAPAQAAAADSVEPTPAKQPAPDTLAPAGVTVTEAGAVPAAESEALKAATGAGGASTAAPPPAQGAVPPTEGDIAEEVPAGAPGYYANTDPAEAAAIGALAASRPPPATAPTPPPAPLTPAAPAQAAPSPVPPASQPVAPAAPTPPVAPPPAMASSPAPAPAAVPPAPQPTAAVAPPPPLTPQAPPQPAQATVAPEPAPVAAAPAPAPTVAAPAAALQPTGLAPEEQVEPGGTWTPQTQTRAAEKPLSADVAHLAGALGFVEDGRRFPDGNMRVEAARQAETYINEQQREERARGVPRDERRLPSTDEVATIAGAIYDDLAAEAGHPPHPESVHAPEGLRAAARTSREREAKAAPKVSVAEKPEPAAKTPPAPTVAPQAKVEPAPAAAPSPAKVEATPPAPTSTFETLPTPHKMAATKLSSRMEPEFHDAAVRKEAAARAVRDLAGNENLPPGSLNRLFKKYYSDIEEERATQERAAAARPRVEEVAKEKAVKAEERAAEVKAEPRKKVRGEARAAAPEAIRSEKTETTVRRATKEVAEKGAEASPAAKRVMEGVEKQKSRKRQDILTGTSYIREGKEMYAQAAEAEAKKAAGPSVEEQVAVEAEGAEKVREAIQKRKREAALKKTAENEAKAKDVLEKAELPSAAEMADLKPGEWIKEVQDAVRFVKQQVKEQGIEVPERHQTLRGPYTNLLTLIQNASAEGKILGPNPDLEALVDVATAYNDVVHEGKHEEFSEEIRSRAEDLGAGATSYDENGITTGDEDKAPDQDRPLDEILRFARTKAPKHTPAESGQSYTSTSPVQVHPENTKVKPIAGKTEADHTIYNVQSGVSITAKKILKASEMLRAEKANVKAGDIPAISKAIWKKLDEILAAYLPNMEVHIVSNEDMEKLFGRTPGNGKTGGVFSLNDAKLMAQGKQGVLIINEAFWNGPQEMQQGHLVTPGQVLRHEMVHALSELVIQDVKNPFRNALYHLTHEARLTYIQSLGYNPHTISEDFADMLTHDIYGFSHPAEFLSEGYSNPHFQSLLANLPTTEHMEQALQGIPQKSMWDRFIRTIAQMLKLLGYGKQGMTSLEALVRLGDATLLSAGESQQAAADFLSQKKLTEYGPGVVPQPGMVTASDLEEFMRQDNAPDRDPFAGPPRAWQHNAEVRFQQWFEHPTGKAADAALTGSADWLKKLGSNQDQSDAILKSVRDKGLLDVNPNDGLTNLDRLYQTVEHANYLSKAEREEGLEVLKNFRTAWEKWTPDQRKDFIDTAYDSTRADIHPDDAIGAGKNGHVSVTDAKDAGKREVHKDVSAAWGKFTPEMKTQWKETGDYFTKMQNKRSQAIGEALIDEWGKDPSHTLAPGWTPATASQAVADGVLSKPKAQQTQSEKDLIKSLGSFGKTLREVAGLSKIKGYYVPLSRRGPWVLSGKEDFDVPANGALLKNGNVAFNTEAEAETFLKTHPYGTLSEQSWAPNAQGVWQRVGKKTAGAQSFFVVKVPHEYVSFHENKADAKRARAKLLADPTRRFLPQNLSQPEERKAMFYGSNELGPQALKALNNSIDTMDLPDGLKELLKLNAEQAATRLMQGNRIKHHQLPRRNIAGYSTDHAHNLADYVQSAAIDLAQTKTAPAKRKYEKLVDEERQAKRYDDNADARNKAIDEIKGRIQDVAEGKHRSGAGYNMLQRFVFANYLGSLRYSLTNMLQLPTWGIPKLIQAHGERAAMSGMRTGFKAVSGYWRSLGRGLRGDALEDMIARVGRSGLPRAQEHVDLLKALKERNRLDMDSTGLEIEAEARRRDTGIKPWEVTKQAARALEDVLRRLPRAVELVNRVPLLIASYEAARNSNANPAVATRIALDTVNESQFNYDPLNQPRIHNKPALRFFLKFKKFAFGAYSSMVHTLADTAGVFSKDPGTRKAGLRAMRSLGYLFLLHWAISGLGAGLPLEPISIVLWLISSLGLADTSDFESRKLRKWLAAHWMSDKAASFVVDGPLRTFGRMDLSGSINLSQLMFFDKPKSLQKKDVAEWVFNTGLGAPGGMIWNAGEAVKDFKNGDIIKGLEKLVPLKAVKDALKAYRQGTEGSETKAGVPYAKPTDVIPAIIQAVTGIKPQSQTRQEEETFGRKGDEARLKEARNKAIADFAKARMGTDPEAKRAAREAQREWNKTHKGDEKITEETIIRSVERRKQNRKKANKELEKVEEGW